MIAIGIITRTGTAKLTPILLPSPRNKGVFKYLLFLYNSARIISTDTRKRLRKTLFRQTKKSKSFKRNTKTLQKTLLEAFFSTHEKENKLILSFPANTIFILFTYTRDKFGLSSQPCSQTFLTREELFSIS